METNVIELLSKGLKNSFNEIELQEIMNRFSIVKNEYVSLCNKKNQDEF
ncbi:hypothetical protein [Clostridium sp. YIM B02555]|nr:hypothetical protein [Clostridium sp. YIM B02555]